ncbi:LytTR family DNA-binding domain-containing protein [uncultured Bacteroides sp.]|uniref:LytR/AlgR family response regulator transcription factor n=1 Tax=uncultured Bacteroides sp. TaxID=162156 RepID=UPI002638057B|nr:LytTR family DNA-binding domain-containing protein [uncultured Bacteroides sp.]
MTEYMILEDERFAYEEIKRMMTLLRPDYRLQAWADGGNTAVEALSQAKPELLIVDIRLSDGLCFDVFERLSVNVPVIFTTAYDEYAIQAFKVNSVDYLLKPIEEEALERALQKFERNCLWELKSEPYRALETSYLQHVKKNRFLVSVGDSFRYVETSEVAFFFSEEKYVYLHTFSGKQYIVDYSLSQLEKLLGTDDFFRVSRNCIAHIKSIKKASRYFGGRLAVEFSPACPQEVVISRNRVNDFLNWLGGSQC